jgi:hypothetical protein
VLIRSLPFLVVFFWSVLPCAIAEEIDGLEDTPLAVEGTAAEESVEEGLTVDAPAPTEPTKPLEAHDATRSPPTSEEHSGEPPSKSSAVPDESTPDPSLPEPGVSFEVPSGDTDLPHKAAEHPKVPQEIGREGVIVGFPILPPVGESLEPEESPNVFGFLPAPPEPSGRGALLFGLAALLARGIAMWALRLRGRLASTGVLPFTTRLLDGGGRASALLLGLWAVLHLIPRAMAPLVSVAMVGAAFAVGWSLRGYAADAVCGIGLLFGRGLRRDQQLGVGEFSGRVLRVGLFSTVIWSTEGRVVRIPNRELSSGVMSSSERSTPRTELTVRLPVAGSSQRQHALLRDSVLLSPYLDASADPEIWQDAEHAEVWHIRVVLGTGEWAQPFREACRRAVRTENFDG